MLLTQNEAKYPLQIKRKSNQNTEQIKKPDHPFTSTDCLRAQNWCGTYKRGGVGGLHSAPTQPAVLGGTKALQHPWSFIPQVKIEGVV